MWFCIFGAIHSSKEPSLRCCGVPQAGNVFAMRGSSTAVSDLLFPSEQVGTFHFQATALLLSTPASFPGALPAWRLRLRKLRGVASTYRLAVWPPGDRGTPTVFLSPGVWGAAPSGWWGPLKLHGFIGRLRKGKWRKPGEDQPKRGCRVFSPTTPSCCFNFKELNV